MVMLATAVDVSIDEKKKFLVMAGLVCSVEGWNDFDFEWRHRLRRDGLSCFHMSEFAHSTQTFKGFKNDEPRRRNLLNDLLEIIRAHAYRKFGSAIEAAAFTQMAPESREYFAPTQIAMAGRFLWAGIERWRLCEKYQQPAELVFEDGDADKGSLIKIIKEITGTEPIFRPKCDRPEKEKPGFTPLQASDILAYETMKVLVKIDKPGFDLQFRYPYKQLEHIPGVVRVLTPEIGPELEDALRVDEYFSKNPLGGDPVQ
jgi:hypothetical protein